MIRYVWKSICRRMSQLGCALLIVMSGCEADDRETLVESQFCNRNFFSYTSILCQAIVHLPPRP